MEESATKQAQRRRESASDRAFYFILNGGILFVFTPGDTSYSWVVRIFATVLCAFGIGLIIYSYTPVQETRSEPQAGLRGLAEELRANYQTQRRRQSRLFALLLLTLSAGIVLVLGDFLAPLVSLPIRGDAITRSVGARGTLLSGGFLALYYREQTESQAINRHLTKIYNLLTAEELADSLPQAARLQAKLEIIRRLTDEGLDELATTGQRGVPRADDEATDK